MCPKSNAVPITYHLGVLFHSCQRAAVRLHFVGHDEVVKVTFLGIDRLHFVSLELTWLLVLCVVEQHTIRW